jgi:hypothetical protein
MIALPSLFLAVVVELFTSQGCSSCPPADALLQKLDRDPNVIAVAYHVHYWDTASWHDPFASVNWTQRQMEYVRAMRLPSAYTPQVVVNGTQQLVGSNEPALRTAIGRAPKFETDVRVTLENGGAVIVTNAPRAGLELYVVGLTNQATTKVEGGENDGSTLVNTTIARQAFRVTSLPAGPQTQRVQVSGDRVIALLQDPATKRIVGAGEVRKATAAARP